MARYTPPSSVGTLIGLRAELTKVATAINDTLSRKGDTPNQMEADLDMNSNQILNLPAPRTPTEPVRVQDIEPLLAGAKGTMYIGEAAPTTPFNGMRWYNPNVPITYVYYKDGDSGQWVEESSRGTTRPASVPNLKALPDSNIESDTYEVVSFYEGWAALATAPEGGGVFTWHATRPVSQHNGVTVYAPDALKQWDGSPSTVSSMLNWTGSGVGCWVRVGANKKYAINIEMGGAVAASTVDSTAAINKVVDVVGLLGGGRVNVPAGFYYVSDQIVMGRQSVYLHGESRFASLLMQTTMNRPIVVVDGNFCQIKSLSAMYQGTPVLGGTAIRVERSYVSIDDIVIRSAFTGIHWIGANSVAGKLTNFEILDFESSGLLVQSTNDLFVDRFIINAGNTTRGILGGIRLVDKVEALIVSNGDILLGVNSLTSDAGTYALGVRPAYNCFTNVFFDSAVNSTIINKMVETDFVNCWFSGGRHGGGNAGCIVQNSRSIRFNNTKFFNSGGSGVSVANTATDISFVNCKAESNSVTAGVGVSHGFQFQNGCTEFKVIGCTASNGLYTGRQGYGIFIGSGCDDYEISGNNLKGNETGAMLDGSFGTATDRTVRGNKGYRTLTKGVATIPTSATTVVVNHGLPVTPRISDISLQRTTSNAGSTDLFVSNITATSFTINTLPAPSSNIGVRWSVDIQS